MKTELKVKFLQYLNQKKQQAQGFTLFELLVVMLIMGILAAIAMPSFLSQSNKAKQAEGKSLIGAINKGQQAYFTQQGQFGTDVSSLGLGIKTQTISYVYTTSIINPGTANSAYSYSSLASPGSGLKNYGGLVSLTQGGATSDVTSISIICETDQPATSAITPSSAVSCGSGSTLIGG